MYASILLTVAAITSLVTAQTNATAALPTCATNCISLPAQCNLNPACICNDAQWIADISCCVSTSCSAGEQQQALDYARNFCTPVGAVLPSSASCANGTSNSTSSTSSRASSSATGVSSVLSSATSAAAASASSAAKGPGNQITVPAAGGIIGAIFGAVALL